MTRDATPRLLSLRPDHPDFLDLSWGVPVADWTTRCDCVEELPRGASRHPVVFVSYDVDPDGDGVSLVAFRNRRMLRKQALDGDGVSLERSARAW
jgi:hypothetical protein